MTDYKSRELNIYSGDGTSHLFLRDGKTNPNWAPGFGLNQKYQYLRYTDVADSAYMHPIVVAGLHYLDTNGFVSGVGWSFYEVKNSITTESKARVDADSKLTTDLGIESKARADADSKLTTDLGTESTARSDADSKLTTDLAAETAARQQADNGNWATILIVEGESKTRDSALDVKLDIEKTRAETAESKLTTDLATELKAREDADTKLSDRIDFIISNTNPTAIDSLSEIVAQFSQNGVGYADRLTYLEGVVAALVNKSQ